MSIVFTLTPDFSHINTSRDAGHFFRRTNEFHSFESLGNSFRRGDLSLGFISIGAL